MWTVRESKQGKKVNVYIEREYDGKRWSGAFLSVNHITAREERMLAKRIAHILNEASFGNRDLKPAPL